MKTKIKLYIIAFFILLIFAAISAWLTKQIVEADIPLWIKVYLLR